MSWLRDLDNQVFFWFNRLARHTEWLHWPVQTYAKYGVAAFGVLILAALLWARERPSRTLAAVGWTAIATASAEALNQPFGHLFNEARPYADHPGILVLAQRTSDFSFPSDHAVMAGAVAAGMWLVHKRFGQVATVAAVLMAAARVYIGAHYPWDVLAGLAFGAAVTLVGWALLQRPLTTLTTQLRELPGLASVFGVAATEPTENRQPSTETSRD